MSIFKRMIKSITRRPVKAGILLVIMIILGSIMVAAISTQMAINNTITALRRQMPPLVTVIADQDYFDERWISDGHVYRFEVDDVDLEDIIITADHLYELAQLSYVYEIYASNRTFFQSTYLVQQLGGRDDWVMYFNAYATSNANILYFREGVLEIVDGRLPTDEELRRDSDIPPIVIPQELAQLNSLFVGDSIEMFRIIPGLITFPGGGYGFSELSYTEEYAFARMGWEFEIVGTFEWVDREVGTRNVLADQILYDTLLQTMFIPLHVADEMGDFFLEQLALQHIELEWDIDLDNPPHWEQVHYIVYSQSQNTIILYDSLYLDNFNEAASSILPDLVITTDLSNSFEDMRLSMEFLQVIADYALLFAFVATVIVLGLLIMLFLYDRRQEIGIYLALGEKRFTVVLQILSEVVVIAFIGIIISLVIGTIVSTQVSQTIIRNELAQLPIISSWEDVQDGIIDISLFSRQMSHEEMLEVFEPALTLRTVTVFVGVGLGAVVISTALPVIYIIKLSPKKILMSGKIE